MTEDLPYYNLLNNLQVLCDDPNSYIGNEPTKCENLERAQDQLTKRAIPICGKYHFETKKRCLNCFKILDEVTRNTRPGNSNNIKFVKYCNEKCGNDYRNRKKDD